MWTNNGSGIRYALLWIHKWEAERIERMGCSSVRTTQFEQLQSEWYDIEQLQYRDVILFRRAPPLGPHQNLPRLIGLEIVHADLHTWGGFGLFNDVCTCYYQDAVDWNDAFSCCTHEKASPDRFVF